MHPDQRDKPHVAEVFFVKPAVGGARDAYELLKIPSIPDRDHEPAADRELFDKGRRDLRSARRHHDGVERSVVRPTERAVGV